MKIGVFGGIASAGFVLAACAGRGGLSERDGPAPQPPAPAAPGAAYEPLGSRPILGTIAAPDYVLVGCAYSAGEGLEGHLVLDVPLASAGEPALGDLASILAALEASRARPEPPRPAAAPSRNRPFLRYELAVSARWILDLFVDDAGEADAVLGVTAAGADVGLGTDFAAPALAGFLRSEAFRALRGAMARPRVAAPWHHGALARFALLDPAAASFLPAGPDSRRRLLLEVVESLRRAPDPEPIAVALLPGLGFLGPEDLAPLANRDEASLRVLALAARARAGDRAALGEILRLSLEFFGRERLFAASLSALFPPARNPGLSKRHPAPARSSREANAFLSEIRSAAPSATFSPGGWSVEG